MHKKEIQMQTQTTTQPFVGVLITPSSTLPGATALAYAAGLMDGEGCIQVIKQMVAGHKNPSYRLRLEMAQNDLATLANFVHCDGLPATVRPVKREANHSRQVWRVTYDGPQAYAALRRLLRYLVRKKAEAAVGIDFVRRGRIGLHPGPKGTPARLWVLRETYFRELRALKAGSD